MQHEIRVHKQNKILYRVINDTPLNNMYGEKIALQYLKALRRERETESTCWEEQEKNKLVGVTLTDRHTN